MYARISILLLVSLLVFTSCQERKADFFEREAKEFTETNCPRVMDSFTTLDSIAFKKDGEGELRMYYTLSLNEESRSELMNKLGELGDMNLSNLRNSIELTQHREAGVSFSYIYRDAMTGEKIVEYHFTKKDYQ